MSQHIVSQKTERVCDGCGKTTVYEMVGAGEAELLDMSAWITHGRRVFISMDHDPLDLVMHSCSAACAPLAVAKLIYTPPEESPEINLDSLRTGIN